MVTINRIVAAAGLQEEILQSLDNIDQDRLPVYELQQNLEKMKPLLYWRILRRDTFFLNRTQLSLSSMADVDVPHRAFPAIMRFEQVHSIRDSSAVSSSFQLRSPL